MARMHSRKRGKAGSTRPEVRTKPGWVRYGAKELAIIIQKLGKEGKSSSEIGMILRDVYGIPDVRPILNTKITKVLAEKKLTGELPEDLLALIRKAIYIRKHLETNNKDQPARRGLLLTESKINRLAKYYKSKNVLEFKWKYEPDRFKMYAEWGKQS